MRKDSFNTVAGIVKGAAADAVRGSLRLLKATATVILERAPEALRPPAGKAKGAGPRSQPGVSTTRPNPVGVASPARPAAQDKSESSDVQTSTGPGVPPGSPKLADISLTGPESVKPAVRAQTAEAQQTPPAQKAGAVKKPAAGKKAPAKQAAKAALAKPAVEAPLAKPAAKAAPVKQAMAARTPAAAKQAAPKKAAAKAVPAKKAAAKPVTGTDSETPTS